MLTEVQVAGFDAAPMEITLQDWGLSMLKKAHLRRLKMWGHELGHDDPCTS
jgi:hypothetical protein